MPPGHYGIAVPFEAKIAFEINFLDLALIHLGGTNSAQVSLHQDAAGAPGFVLDSWTVSAAPVPYALVGVVASRRITSGQYWILIRPGGDDTNLGWAFNSQNFSGMLAATRDGTTYVPFSYTLPAFDVLGNPVPEPSTLFLSVVAGAFLGCGALRPSVSRWCRTIRR